MNGSLKLALAQIVLGRLCPQSVVQIPTPSVGFLALTRIITREDENVGNILLVLLPAGHGGPIRFAFSNVAISVPLFF